MSAPEPSDRRTVRMPFLKGLVLVLALDAVLVFGGQLLSLNLVPLAFMAVPYVGLLVAISGWAYVRRAGPEWLIALGAVVATMVAMAGVGLYGMAT